MRVAISLTASRYDTWHLWRIGKPGRWTVVRTLDLHLPVPEGFHAAQRYTLLTVSDEERRRELKRLEGIPGLNLDTAEERIQWAEEMVRIGRRDPTHDWFAWVAPLRLMSDEASGEWANAVTSIHTTHSHVVLRPHVHGGWLAWVGLGSFLAAVTPPGYIPRAAGGARRVRSFPGAPRQRVGPPAYWPSREEARAAAVERIRASRADLHHLLPDWDPEAREDLLTGRANARTAVFGSVPLRPDILIHEGPAAGGGASWDLPVVEMVPASSQIV